MCKIHNPRKMDKCIKPLIKWLQNKHTTVASCCGHGKYPPTIVVKEGITIKDKSMATGRRNTIVFREIFSQLIIPRTKRFYVKDNQGYYYIPETVSNSTSAMPIFHVEKEFNKDSYTFNEISKEEIKMVKETIFRSVFGDSPRIRVIELFLEWKYHKLAFNYLESQTKLMKPILHNILEDLCKKKIIVVEKKSGEFNQYKLNLRTKIGKALDKSFVEIVKAY